ncbi:MULTISPECIES: AAA-like domain-containing protein [unclassified Polaromonas]|uniref:tetratricopeptide repeat protein n=1 Tax=unclassified Polaromonas TaxID=2638319 RepID=UPI000F076E56|nr:MULTISPECIES: AAA-like domain-containing protein [unclassified Polaromonas]AYQ29238.1 hypothetical protein DT070_15125 [Polaromonas sp. SP1]QGJ19648.1 tetratricopeptide repeat protein [Polaromonas sp. Pch-P]
MSKLRSHTIVPGNLYVRRKADEQVAQIIEDMGRPGYVLVARQMGKTNLLLNAKREASETDLFAYLDVSNVFPDLRGFFRNIVDVATEALKEQGVFLAEAINRDRGSEELLSHKEHERELRRILQVVTGKLIICLDEIDALTKTPYSDQIFSFIRSIYFSGRSNIPEFSRLTYILSGVAEPTELIRNKAISPFNIGEKIYLDDFTFDEFDRFLKLTEIEFSEEVCDRIFYWTSGHPRMTWDVVSAVEKRSPPFTGEVVDSAVQELYFSAVDLPPIDHIKSIVENSREIRDAVVAIHYGKAGSLTESLRTKLYLAGISRFDVQTRQVFFKNKVLETSLSEEFLRSVGERQTSFEVGLKYFGNAIFDESLSAFAEFITNQPSDPRIPLAQYWAGVSCYRLGRYKEAIAFFGVGNASLPVKSIVARYFFLGMCHLAVQEYVMAVEFLQQAVAGRQVSDFPQTYYEAKIALSGALLHLKSAQNEKTFLDAIALSRSVLEEEGDMRSLFDDESAVKSLLLRAHLNIARAAGQTSTKEQAMASIEEARQYADGAARLTLLLFEHDLSGSYSESASILDRAVQEVFGVRTFDADTVGGGTSTMGDVVQLLGKLQKAGKLDQLAQVIDHVADHLTATVNIYDFVSDLVVDLFNAGKHQLARRIVDRSLKTQATPHSLEDRRGMLTLAIIINEADADRYGEAYLATFESGEAVADVDLRFLAAITAAALNRSNGTLAKRARDVALKVETYQSLTENGSQSIHGSELVKEYLDLLVKLRTSPDPGVAAQASVFLRRLASLKSFSLTYFPENFHRTMQVELLRRMRGNVRTVPFKRDKKKYGRNDLVVVDYDGVLKKGKYKLFSNDIDRGLCKLVDVPEISTPRKT